MRETHIFDVDHTLLKTSTGSCFIREGIRRRILNLLPLLQVPFYLIKYRQARLDDKILEKEIHFLKGIDRSLLFDLGRVSFERYGKKRIYSEAADLISELKNRKARIIFATSSFDFLILPVAGFFSVENIVCSQMEFREGKCTGKTEGKPAFGIYKKERTMQFLLDRDISPECCYFYSDSYYDMPLFSAVSHPVAVNPDKKLKKYAVQNDWDSYFYKTTLNI